MEFRGMNLGRSKASAERLGIAVGKMALHEAVSRHVQAAKITSLVSGTNARGRPMPGTSAQERQVPDAWRIEYGAKDRRWKAAFTHGPASRSRKVASGTARQIVR